VLTLQLMKSSIIKYFTISILFLVSCSVKDTDVVIPETILSKEETIKIITDCYLAEGASGINVKAVTGQNIDSVYLFNPLKDNNCTKTKFDSSILFYSKHPVMLKQIYDDVLEELNKIAAKGKL
jgi:hypothetical protein